MLGRELSCSICWRSSPWVSAGKQGLGWTAVGGMQHWDECVRWVAWQGARDPTVDLGECLSYFDDGDVGGWAVWQADPRTNWQGSGALPWVV